MKQCLIQIKANRCIRYYDDIQYGCEGEEEAYRVLSLFENALREFELEINPDKVHMISGPHNIGSPWLLPLRNFEWQSNIKTDKLMEIFSFVAEMAQKYPEDQVFRFFLGKMRTSIVSDDAWTAYQRILLSLLQESRGNAKEVFEQLSYYHRIGFKINKKILKEALDRKVQHQLTRGVTSELSWAIYGYLFFNINISKTLATKTLQKGDTSSKVLVAKLIFQRNMALKSDINTLVRNWGNDILNSSEWLFAYEVFVNRWHDRRLSVTLPDNVALFEHLRDERVSFLDENSLTGPSLPSVFKDRLPPPPEPEEETEDRGFEDFITDDIEDDSTDEDIEDMEEDETGIY